MFDPVARNIMALYPDPTGPGDPITGRHNYTKKFVNSYPGYQFDIKIDYVMTDKTRYFGSLQSSPLDRYDSISRGPTFGCRPVIQGMTRTSCSSTTGRQRPPSFGIIDWVWTVATTTKRRHTVRSGQRRLPAGPKWLLWLGTLSGHWTRRVWICGPVVLYGYGQGTNPIGTTLPRSTK